MSQEPVAVPQPDSARAAKAVFVGLFKDPFYAVGVGVSLCAWLDFNGPGVTLFAHVANGVALAAAGADLATDSAANLVVAFSLSLCFVVDLNFLYVVTCAVDVPFFCGAPLPKSSDALPSCSSDGFPELSPLSFFAIFCFAAYIALNDVRLLFRWSDWLKTQSDDMCSRHLATLVAFVGALQLKHAVDWEINRSQLTLLVFLLTCAYELAAFAQIVLSEAKYFSAGTFIFVYLSLTAQLACIRENGQSVLFGRERLLPTFNVALTFVSCVTAATQLYRVARRGAEVRTRLTFARLFFLNVLLLLAFGFIVIGLLQLHRTPFFWAVLFTCGVYLYTLFLRISTESGAGDTAKATFAVCAFIVDSGLCSTLAVRAAAERSLAYYSLTAGVGCAALHGVLLFFFWNGASTEMFAVEDAPPGFGAYARKKSKGP